MIACTIVTKSHLAFARTLALSLAEHNPGSRLLVLLADEVEGCFDPASEPFTLLRLEELPDRPAVARMRFYYTPFELCCALRGLLHEHMLRNTAEPKWVYLDSDILVCHSLESLWRALDSSPILLTPHFLRPPEDTALLRGHEAECRRRGLFNAGFLGLRRSDAAESFVAWFKRRLQWLAFDDVRQGLSGDQPWLDFVPLYFPAARSLREPGANFAFWNFFERRLSRDEEGRFLVNGEPLLFCHFGRFDISDPEASARCRALGYEREIPPEWPRLAQAYRNLLLANGYDETSRLPYAFAHLADGRRITLPMRRAYYRAVARGEADPAPFEEYGRWGARMSQLKELAGMWGRAAVDAGRKILA